VRFGRKGPLLPADAELIRSLAALLDETGLTEIEYAVGDRLIRVARAPAARPPTPASPGVTETTSAAAGFAEHPGAVTAPMVGTAYLAPQPGEPPFVRVGDTVEPGQPLLIIEAMKVMNQIRAPRAGQVARILVADAQPVEYGAVLMLIE
jgi:acetyl-CoA carboxylase biotin carboxyl carrier protein